MTVWYNSEKG